MKIKPYIKCAKISSLNIKDWNAVEEAFKDADFAEYQQAWRPEPEPEFRPAKAAAAWTGKSLIIYAKLCDDDIHNDIPESKFNEMSILFGDVFEIFLKPSGQESYFEFHINPNNQKFQLKFPFKNAPKLLRPKFESGEMTQEMLKVRTPIESRVEVSEGSWRVVAKIPLAMMVENEPVKAGTEWLFSFCRYDYTRPSKTPIYSSTSPHAEINYHLMDDYGTMEFA